MNLKSSSPHTSRRTNGFTLLEVMVASALGLIIILMMLNASQLITNSFDDTEEVIIRQGDAGFALDQIVQDLEGHVIPKGVNAEGLHIRPDPVNGAESSWLLLLTTAIDRDTAAPSQPLFTGSTRAVSYRLAHQNPIDGTAENPSFGIYRAVASARHTFNEAVGEADLLSGFWQGGAMDPSGASLDPTGIENFVSPNIVQFQVRFQRADNDQWTPPNSEIRMASNGTTVNGVAVPGGFVRAEVSLTVLSPEGGAMLNRPGNPMPLEEAIQRYGQTYVRQTSFF